MTKKRKVYKLNDKSLVIGTELESTINTVTIEKPINITQILNPQTREPEIAFVPLDLIFNDVQESKNNVTINKQHIIWEKDLSDFPSYDSNYVKTTTGIETSTSGIIKG